MDELKSWEPSILQKLFSAAGSGMEKASDWLVEKNNPLAFIPYFLSGGHDAAESLNRLGYEGFDRPYRHGQLGQAGHTRVLGDLFIGSQPLTIPGIPMAAKAGLSKIPVKGLQNMSRREFIKKGGALAGSTAASTMLGKALMGLADEAPVAQVAQKVAPKVAEAVAPTYKYNSLVDYLTDVLKRIKYDDPVWDTPGFMSKEKALKELLDSDEEGYRLGKEVAKDGFSYTENGVIKHDLVDSGIATTKDIENLMYNLDSFSPQAKEEMKALKLLYGDKWTSFAENPYNIESLKKYGTINSPNESNFFYSTGEKQWDFGPSPKKGFNFWDETGTHGLNEGTKSIEEVEKLFQQYINEFL